jgi:anaerobic ribonucleoside-triphosphate reductase activating protein
MDNEIKSKLAGITESLTEAEGTAVVLWYQGCDKNCIGCHNPEVASLQWEHGFFIDFTALTEYLSKYIAWVDWIVFSGGEPLLQKDAVLMLAHWAKHHLFDKNGNLTPKKLWLYTWHEFDDISDNVKEVMDVIKTGPYIQELRDTNLKFRGSSNQKLFKKFVEIGKEDGEYNKATWVEWVV